MFRQSLTTVALFLFSGTDGPKWVHPLCHLVCWKWHQVPPLPPRVDHLKAIVTQQQEPEGTRCCSWSLHVNVRLPPLCFTVRGWVWLHHLFVRPWAPTPETPHRSSMKGFFFVVFTNKQSMFLFVQQFVSWVPQCKLRQAEKSSKTVFYPLHLDLRHDGA